VAGDSGISRRTLLKGVAALGAGLALGPATGTSRAAAAGAPRGQRRREQPNIIVITADDMRYDEAPYMPSLQRLMVKQGTSFTAARCNIAECSPSRAGFLTGQYSKRHRVLGQVDSFSGHNDVQRTLPVWMQAAGYHTGIIGKYFTTVEGRSTPPGWDVRRQLADKNQEQYGFAVWDGVDLQKPKLDQTRYLQQEVLSFLERARRPFFLWFTPTANHGPFQAPPTHRHDYARLQWPDRRETDVRDKPVWIQELDPIDGRVMASMRRAQRLRLRELLGLDDTVAAIFEHLRAAGTLDDTVVIFTSDNGEFWGEHRIPPGSKNLPYEPAVRTPCIVRGPGFRPTTIRQPVHMSMDLTATCVELGGAAPDLALDGVSLMQVAADPGRFDDRQLLYERGSQEGLTFVYPHTELPPLGDGIFTRKWKLTRYRTEPAVVELYDLDADPGEGRNVADDPAYADDRASLEAALDRLLAG
jgi:arylsulfatase A-like enzyme